ncbi:TetR/AcrR family transcriptional regulator [Nocardia stercoris]|uniref:TetR/AcrR family transcriptional regulator n=1 Tax=Nocardia stercoris TaxID=2483361 RepID=A0A3M2KTE6_9NOCA|nr:TetR/AcrR family transcriptional regulator [Nocardia stercoris]RMI27740.1 TetR/AcrR family transcriptional regulator [Nocardia stercoris]
MAVSPPVAGRPRDARIDEAVLQATRELVAECGYSDLTMTAIAARAGTSVPALRRRWATKAQVVHEAVFPESAARAPETGGSLADEIRVVVETCVELLCSEAGRRATPGLIADLAADPELQRQLSARMWSAAWDGLAARIDRATARGEIRAPIDLALFVETVFGTTLMAVVLRGPEAVDAAWRDSFVATLLHGLAV